MVLINRGLTEPEEQSHREGWLASFDNLDHVLSEGAAGGEVRPERRRQP